MNKRGGAMSKNKNRIVRVRSKKFHDVIEQVSRETSVSYQEAFDMLCEYIEDGYTIGSNSAGVIFYDIIRKWVEE